MKLKFNYFYIYESNKKLYLLDSLNNLEYRIFLKDLLMDLIKNKGLKESINSDSVIKLSYIIY